MVFVHVMGRARGDATDELLWAFVGSSEEIRHAYIEMNI